MRCVDDQRTQAAYSSLLSTHIPPGVNSLKALIEEAWEHVSMCDHPYCNAPHAFTSGFDQEGAEGLKGNLVGRKEWIGTAGMMCTNHFVFG